MFTKSLTRSSMATLGAIAIALTSGLAASADVANGSFDDGGAGGWFSYGFVDGSTSFDGGQFCGTVPAGTVNPWDVGFGQNDLVLPAGDYTFGFDISGDGPVRAVVGQNGGAYATYAEQTSIPGATMSHYDVGFTLAEDAIDPQVVFQFGGAANEWTFCVDNVSVAPPSTEFLTNGTFDSGLEPWYDYGFSTANVVAGQFCGEIPGGTTNPWDVGLGYNDLTLPAGDYVMSFDASGSGPIRAIVGVNGAPYTVFGEIAGSPGATVTHYEAGFTLGAETSNLQFSFQVGGAASPWTLCLDNVSLLGGVALPAYSPEVGPRVKVNQVGYLTHGPKNATLVTEATASVPWELHNAADAVFASGNAAPAGIDASSGLNVQTIDFTSITAAGDYTLVADGDRSDVFAIGDDLYEQLRKDSLNFFYLMRSGTPIDGSVVGDAYARAAGHVSSPADGVANKGDLAVPCQPAAESLTVYGEPWTCDYTLDVVGGWYDAGDHGKYVVNGGIATAQLLGTFERSKTAKTADLGALGDNSLNVPEHNNAIPDVLDEAKWELDFMLSMQVPAGDPLAGMVHHKIHDYGWTGLPLLPVNDPQTRYLHRPSMAATLNLSATAAQGARLFAPYDKAYADTLLKAARSTWAAALAHPDLYAPAADGNNGGGAYNDSDVSDEFYWAAVELYLTTGEKQFKDYILASPVNTADSFPTSGFSWGSLDAIAKMDLATVPNAFPGRTAVVDQVLAGANGIAAVEQGQAFGQALPSDGYVWGSNSAVLNNIVVLGTAYDLSGNRTYLEAALESMDYILGRNALGRSYVTGWGDMYSENMHSRWFAAQLNPDLPHPPVGTVAGGPNQNTSEFDPTAAALFPDGCAPQFCYVDDINSWSTNELTVNWNSALAFAASFLADQDTGSGAAAPTCEIQYMVHGNWPGGNNTQIWIKNTGTSTINGWTLTWAYPADDKVTSQAWSAHWSQSGATVTATNLSWNGQIRKGQRTTIGFIGDPGTLKDAPPTQFWLNGQPCSTK